MEKGIPLLWKILKGSQMDGDCRPPVQPYLSSELTSLSNGSSNQVPVVQTNPGPCMETQKARKYINYTLIKCNLLFFSLHLPKCQCIGLNCLCGVSPYSSPHRESGVALVQIMFIEQ